MNGTGDFAGVCQRYFGNWLPEQKGVSQNTLRSYAQCFRLLFEYANVEIGISPERLSMFDVNPGFLEKFLGYLEKKRRNTIRTRNARLAAVKSFFGFVALKLPQYCEVSQRVAALPSKRPIKRVVPYLTREELKAILEVIDRNTWVGRRDYTVILFTAETGLRNSELTSLRQADIELGAFPSVKCIGKRRKERRTPMTKATAKVLKLWMDELGNEREKYLFPNRTGGRLSPDSFQYAVKKYSTRAAIQCPSLTTKRMTPHVLRHTAAMELLQAGVDITTIAGWLGHESLASVGVYVQATLKMKKSALEKLTPLKGAKSKFTPDSELLDFLKGL